jgi:hypothetical protein
MTEVMIRAFSINTATKTPTTIPQALIREYCFLQLRMLCELIALGCLVAHGDITKTKYFQKAYKADDILERLGKLQGEILTIRPYPVAEANRDRHLFNPSPLSTREVSVTRASS